MTKIIDKLENNIKEMHWWLRIKPDLPSVCLDAIEVMEESLELLKERLPRKVKNIRDLADLLIGQCPSCGEKLNNEVNPNFCGFCGDRITWEEGEQDAT